MSRLLALIIALSFGPLPALAADPAQPKSALPATPEAWLAQMLDGRKNGAAFKDPAAFAEWLDAITEPRFMTALAAVAVDPAAYPKALANAIDPQAARNWAEFTDPQLYLRWMLASANPSFQQAIVKKMTDPAKMARWIETMSRPDTYTAMTATFGQAPAAWLGAMAEGVGRQLDGQDWLKLPADQLSGARYRY